jgi:membrane protein required for colicin V production
MRHSGRSVDLYDLIVVLLVALAAYRGYRVGLAGKLFGWLAVALGLLLASRYAGTVSIWLARRNRMSDLIAHLLAYVVLFGGAIVVVLVVAHLLTRLLGRVPVVGGANRLGGALIGVFVALICVVLLTGVLVAPSFSHVFFATTVRHSRTAAIVRTLTPSWERRLKRYVLRSAPVSGRTCARDLCYREHA